MRVLIVEDCPTYAKLQTFRLMNSETTRFESHHVNTLADALDFLQNEKADVVLLDLDLPDARGAAAVRAVHLAHSDVPIVVMTGTLDDEIHAAAKMSGATDITRKGADSDETMELRLLAAAYRKAYVRLTQADPMAPVTRALVKDIALHLRNGEAVVKDLRDRLAAGSPIDPEFLDRSLLHVQESLAPMHMRADEDFMLRPLDPAAALLKVGDHVVTLAITGDVPMILGQQSTVERALGSILATMYHAPGPIQVAFSLEGHTVVAHIADPRAPTMRREHPLLWTLATELLALSMATVDVDDTGFTLRFAAASDLDSLAPQA